MINRLETPRGVYLIDRPYDPKLPLSEKVGCGHAIQLIPPPSGSVEPWMGGAKERFERIQPGVHTQSLDVGDMSGARLNNITRGLSVLGLDRFIRQNPLGGLEIKPLPDLRRRGITGMYRTGLQTLHLDSGRSDSTFGRSYPDAWSVSYLAPTRDQALRRSLVHEVGHHILNLRPDLDELVRMAYVSAVKARRFITRQAEVDYQEYFVESLTAFAFERSSMTRQDPAARAMIEEALKRLGLP